MRYIKQSVLLLLLFATSLVANQTLIENLARLSAISLYNLDNEQSINSLKPYIDQNSEIKVIKIVDATDNSTFMTMVNIDGKISYNTDIPKYRQHPFLTEYFRSAVNRILPLQRKKGEKIAS